MAGSLLALRPPPPHHHPPPRLACFVTRCAVRESTRRAAPRLTRAIPHLSDSPLHTQRMEEINVERRRIILDFTYPLGITLETRRECRMLMEPTFLLLLFLHFRVVTNP